MGSAAASPGQAQPSPGLPVERLGTKALRLSGQLLGSGLDLDSDAVISPSSAGCGCLGAAGLKALPGSYWHRAREPAGEKSPSTSALPALLVLAPDFCMTGTSFPRGKLPRTRGAPRGTGPAPGFTCVVPALPSSLH